jgi:hypothetical protein
MRHTPFDRAQNDLPLCGYAGDDRLGSTCAIGLCSDESASLQIAAATENIASCRFAPTADVALKIITPVKARLIKIGAKVVTHGRYVAFQMAEVAIPRDLFADILRMIAEPRAPVLASTA